jgi:predicted enzyme related to lactoylglutathione lyase
MNDSTLSLIILAVSDLPRMMNFYTGVFGWEQTVDTSRYVEYKMQNGMRLGLYERRGFSQNIGGRTPSLIPVGEVAPTELYMYVGDPSAVGERLLMSGARLLSGLELRTWGDQVAYYADPEGNVIAIAQRQHNPS